MDEKKNHTEPVKSQGKIGYKHPPTEFQFKKGFDPRRHVGKPKDFDMLRALVRDLCAEEITLPKKQGGKKIKMALVEAMIRNMLESKNPADRKMILEYGFGRVPYDVKMQVETEEHEWTPDEIERVARVFIGKPKATKKPARKRPPISKRKSAKPKATKR